MVKVYAIRTRTSTDCYIGSTGKPYLSQRWAHHLYNFRQHQSGKPVRWCSSFLILACPTAYIELLEECDDGVRKERERWWVENTPTCVNTHYKPKTEDESAEQRRKQREKMRAWRAQRDSLNR